MQLPTYQPDQVSQNVLPTPQMSGADPVAQAGERLGGTIERTSGQMFDLARDAQIKADSSVVMDSYVNFSKGAMDLQTKALQRKGKDAQDFGETLEDYDKLLNETEGGLKNDRQKDLFKQKSAQERIHFETSLYRHAGEQADALNHANAKAMVDIEEQKLGVAYRDPTQYDIKNPTSQINKLRASVADQLHMAGIPDSDPAFKDAIDKVTSKAYADRIKLLMSEDPKGAKHFLEVHQDEMEPKEVETLKKEVAHLNAEQSGIGAAMAYLDDIKSGKKSETEMTKELHEKFKDDPAAFKVAQAELNHLYTQNRADQVNETVGIASTLETKIDEAMAKGQSTSIAFLKGTDEYKNLSKMAADGNKSAMVELNKVRSYASKVEHQLKQEQKAAAAEARHAQALNRQLLMLKIGDPESIAKMSKKQIYQEGRDAGLTINQIKTLWGQREKAVKDSIPTYHSTDMMNRVLDKSKIAKEDREGFGQAWRGAIKAEETRLGRPMTNKEIEEAGIMGLQHHAKTFLGFKTGTEWVNPNKQGGTTANPAPSSPKPKESDLRTDLKAHGMKQKEIDDYVNAAKEAGKL